MEKQDPMDEAKWKLRDVVTSYIDIAFVEADAETFDGAIEALNKAKKFIASKGKSKLDTIFGGKGTRIS